MVEGVHKTPTISKHKIIFETVVTSKVANTRIELI